MIKNLILGLSALSVGVALYFAVVGLMSIRKFGKVGAADALLGTGYSLVVLLVSEAVSKVPFITGAWRTWAYLLGLLMTAFGLLGIATYRRGELDDAKSARRSYD